MADLKLSIERKDKGFIITPKENLKWETTRKLTPSKLTFSVPDIGFIPETGDKVSFFVGDEGVFKGMVSSLTKNGASNEYSVTAFDSLKYLKNKDNLVYENKKASDVLKLIATQFKLKTGAVDDTKYVIPYRVEDSKTLFDIIETALDITYENTGEEFVLYDNFGTLCLVKENALQKNLLLDGTCFENYNLNCSIDNSFNRIKLMHEDSKKGLRQITIAEDKSLQEKYGVLQYFSHINGDENGSLMAKKLLEELKTEKKTLTVTGVKGDIRVRAGSSIYVDIPEYKGIMMVLKANHTFSENAHIMDLSLKGGDFSE